MERAFATLYAWMKAMILTAGIDLDERAKLRVETQLMQQIWEKCG
jgi:hypothetical protein